MRNEDWVIVVNLFTTCDMECKWWIFAMDIDPMNTVSYSVDAEKMAAETLIE